MRACEISSSEVLALQPPKPTSLRDAAFAALCGSAGMWHLLARLWLCEDHTHTHTHKRGGGLTFGRVPLVNVGREPAVLDVLGDGVQHHYAGACVDRRERVVEQQQRRTAVERAREGHALLLAARERHAALAYLGRNKG